MTPAQEFNPTARFNSLLFESMEKTRRSSRYTISSTLCCVCVRDKPPTLRWYSNGRRPKLSRLELSRVGVIENIKVLISQFKHI